MTEELTFKLEIFEGPLDLLLSLVAKNKYDIFDIPISEILVQYLDYLGKMKEMDMDVAGEFITMASHLMQIKSRMMLPRDREENEEDPRLSLARALEEYKRAKEAAELLSGEYQIHSGRMAKPMDEAPFREIPEISNQDITLLFEAFERLRTRLDEYKTSLPPEKTLENLLKKKVTPIPQKIRGIVTYLKGRGKTNFDEIILHSETRSDIVASFVAVLELLRSNRITIFRQDDDIYLDFNREAQENDEYNEAESYN